MSDDVCMGCGRTDDPRADCLADDMDVVILTLPDGRQVMSVNGQGHLPVPAQ